jgi:hypothetical protein
VLYEFNDTRVEMEGVVTLVDAMKFAALTTEELIVVVLSDGTVRGAFVIIDPVVKEFVTSEFVAIAFVLSVVACICPV